MRKLTKNRIEAEFIVFWCKYILHLPEYKYGWWKKRLALIKEGKIK